jgi:hypothetical protein
MADTIAKTPALSITAADVFTAPATFNRPSVDVHIAGLVDSTVTLQQSIDDAATWLDVKQYTSPVAETLAISDPKILYRLGVKPGDYGTDTIIPQLSQ